VHQSLDRDTVVQRIAGNDPGRGVDGLACLPVTTPMRRTEQSFHAAAGRQLGMCFDDSAVWSTEPYAVVGGALNAEPVFVHQSVVMAAEQHEIVDRGVAAICPVADVMRIDETAMVAARKPAAAVARLQGSAQRRRYGARLAPDIEWITRVVFRYA